MDFQIEIGKINVRAKLTKIDVGWRVFVLGLLVVAGLTSETVCVKANGSDVGDFLVTGGAVVLDDPAYFVEVGFRYTSRVTLLHPNVKLRDGTSQGRVTKVSELVLDVLDTNGGIYVGLEDVDGNITNPQEVPFNFDGDILDEALPLYTGKKNVSIGGWKDEFNIAIEQRGAYPFTLLGTTQKTTITDIP